MMRQRILERAGWTVWRCFASRFVRDRLAVIDEIAAFLAGRGIQPIMGGGEWVSHHTELRVWRSDAAPEDESLVAVDTSEVVEGPSVSQAEALDLFDGENITTGFVQISRVTEAQVQSAIVALMSDGRIWSNGELKKALADVLPLSAADREPAAFRPNEEKWEELVNNALSPSRGNSLHAKQVVKSAGRGLHLLTEVYLEQTAQAPSLVEPTPAPCGDRQYLPPTNEIGLEYQVTAILVPPSDTERIYDADYKPNLEQQIDRVLETEAPIYDDILIERIARAHKKERAGRIIQDIVTGAIDQRHPSTVEDGRRVLFHRDMNVSQIVAYRPARSDWRSHRDIPLIELASLALPQVMQGKTDPDILAHYGRTFALARLREPTRKRFESAICIARETQDRAE
jgi:hypothetical protein